LEGKLVDSVNTEMPLDNLEVSCFAGASLNYLVVCPFLGKTGLFNVYLKLPICTQIGGLKVLTSFIISVYSIEEICS